jgi:hypothetical protein
MKSGFGYFKHFFEFSLINCLFCNSGTLTFFFLGDLSVRSLLSVYFFSFLIQECSDN